MSNNHSASLLVGLGPFIIVPFIYDKSVFSSRAHTHRFLKNYTYSYGPLPLCIAMSMGRVHRRPSFYYNNPSKPRRCSFSVHFFILFCFAAVLVCSCRTSHIAHHQQRHQVAMTFVKNALRAAPLLAIRFTPLKNYRWSENQFILYYLLNQNLDEQPRRERER